MTTVHTKRRLTEKHIMYGVHQHDKPGGDLRHGTAGHAHVVCLLAALALTAAFGLSVMMPAGSAPPDRLPNAAARSSATDPSRFILNALLVPALDGDAVPLRWVDPRPVLRCGPDTAVLVNHEPLVAGALVPDMPFELEWHADGCRPFGAHQARFDGGVKLTVFREDWGFSAMVEPADLRVTLANNETTLVQPGAAWLPQCADCTGPVMLTAIDEGRSLPCR
jgi:hypothetical protein